MSIEFAKYYNVFVITHDGDNISYPYAGTLIDLKLPPASTKIGKITTFFKRILTLRRIKKEYHIDVSISHLPSSNYANIFSRRAEKVVTYVHNMEAWSGKVEIRERLVSGLSNRMICVSEAVRQNMIHNFHLKPEKLTTIYNFCDLSPSFSSRSTESPLTIATMGRLTPQKGQWHLIRAMKKVTDTVGGNVRLQIVGDGEMRQKLEHLADQLGISEKVEFTGFLDDPWFVLTRADVYVSSSLWEGLPMALIEAARCRLPIIATDCDAGCREILAPETDIFVKTQNIEQAAFGILVPVCSEGDAEQLELTDEEQIMADAILLLVQNEDLRKRYSKLAEVRSTHFYAEPLMKQWAKLLEEL